MCAGIVPDGCRLTWPSPAAAQAAIATTDAQSALALQLTQLVNWGQGKPVLQPAPSTAAPARDAQTAHGQLRRSGSGLGGPHTQPLAVAEAAGTTGGEPGSPRGDVGYSGGGWMGSAWQQIAGGRSKRGSGRCVWCKHHPRTTTPKRASAIACSALYRL